MDNKDVSSNHENEKQANAKESSKNTVLLYLHDFVMWLVAILLVFLLLFRVIVVSGPSMNMTLVDGDYLLLINNFLYPEPKQGDIIVAAKESFKNGEPIIKRVIATEGQWVDIDFELGIVYVNGTALDEPYTNTLTNLYEGVEFPLMVDEGCVFVMGDNRNMSTDSRDKDIDMVDERLIIGKVYCVLFPISSFGLVE